MGMILKNRGFVLRELKSMPIRARRGYMNKLRSKGKKVVRRAIEYAPVDKGNLEAAIQMEELFAKGAIIFSVAESVNGVNVSDYAIHMHEGVYNLGPGSRAKDAGTGTVGRKYLERAVEDEVEDFEDELAAAIERALF